MSKNRIFSDVVRFFVRTLEGRMSNTKYGYPCAGNTLLPRAEGGNRGRLFGEIQDVNAREDL
jgi:hypothetical protein